MNSRQRRQSMTRRHMQWPLGARVLVRGLLGGEAEGKVHKHWREHPGRCSVMINDATQTLHQVSFSRLRLIDTHLRGQRPWYKALRQRAATSA